MSGKDDSGDKIGEEDEDERNSERCKHFKLR